MGQPYIDLNFRADPAGIRDLEKGMRLAWKVVCSEDMAEAYDRVVGFNGDIVGSDEYLRYYIVNNVGTFCHGFGTAPIGPEAGSVCGGGSA